MFFARTSTVAFFIITFWLFRMSGDKSYYYVLCVCVCVFSPELLSDQLCYDVRQMACYVYVVNLIYCIWVKEVLP